MFKRSKIQILLLVILFLLFSAKDTNALKKFVSKKNNAPTGYRSYIPSKVSYRADKRGLFLSFSSFSTLNWVDYLLTYETSGIQQGVGGRITLDNDPQNSRELLFGTCSGGVCKYHSDLKNASLTLTSSLKSGLTVKKIYRIRTYY